MKNWFTECMIPGKNIKRTFLPLKPSPDELYRFFLFVFTLFLGGNSFRQRKKKGVSDK